MLHPKATEITNLTAAKEQVSCPFTIPNAFMLIVTRYLLARSILDHCAWPLSPILDIFYAQSYDHPVQVVQLS